MTSELGKKKKSLNNNSKRVEAQRILTALSYSVSDAQHPGLEYRGKRKMIPSSGGGVPVSV